MKIDAKRLLPVVLAALDGEAIHPPRVVVTKTHVEAGEDTRFDAIWMSAGKVAADLSGSFPLPNLVDLMADLMARTSPPVRLTRATLLEIFRRSKGAAAGAANP